MNIIHLTALGTLALTLHLQAQTPAPAPPVAGPTMEQTVTFIDDMLNQHGHYSVGYPPDWRIISDVYESQRLYRRGDCALEYESIETVQLRKDDGSPDAPIRLSNIQKLSLNLEDPRSMTVEMGYEKAEPTEWSVRLNAEDNLSLYTNGSLTRYKTAAQNHRMKLGFFSNKDIADRVAKAYIHAMVLCHKPEAPSLL